MTEFRPMLEDEPGAPLERLLGSTRLDVPPEDGKARLLAGLLVSGAGAAATFTTAAAAAKLAEAGAVSPAGVTAALVGKWVAWGALAGTLVMGSVQAVVYVAQRPGLAAPAAGAVGGGAPKAAKVPEQVPEKSVAPVEVEPPPPPPPVAAVASEPSENIAAEAPSGAASAAPAGSGSGSESHSLSEEVAALDLARAELAAHRPLVALVALDTHDARFGSPMLGPETTLLRIQALADAGRHAAARAIGARFLAAHSDSAHAERVRKLLEASPAPP